MIALAREHHIERKPIPFDELDFAAFGAVGDGVTDDTAAIQAAIDEYVEGQTSVEASSLTEPQEPQAIAALPLK